MSDLTKAQSGSLLKDKFGIAFGAFGSNLGSAFLMTYLTYYMTDSMMISAASGAIILLVARILDGIADLWMGTLIDRCKRKSGKARPWLLWMAAPTVVSMALLFYVPNFTEGGRVAYTFVTYIICAFFTLTAIYLPVQSLTALVTSDPKQRLVISQISGFFVTLGAVFLNYFSTPIMAAFGGGNAGYFWYATLLGFIAGVFLVICFFLTNERALSEMAAPQKDKTPVLKGLSYIFRNKYWWIAMVLYLVVQLVPSCWAATPYYTKYFTNDSVDTGHLMALLWGGITIGIPLFVPVTRKIGKMYSSAIGIALQAIGGVMLWLAPYSIAMCWVSTVFRSIGVGALLGNMGALMADVCEYGDWKFGVRSEGLIYSGTSLGNKIGQALGGVVVMALLAWGNYVPNAVTQTAQAMTGIKVAFIAFPFVGDLLIIVLLLLFRVEKMMPQIRADLEERRKKASA
ncbi:glycoside/pentoside/hexuronide:cation symporter, GPH family [Sporobacter termitidis DSM 10068]|uniref:Glycoside/pentoside/hexuronide:cation symporter, GPH family n=1 Tax=Sporobacter termitidis DSM 10068 TaxID=1123282 RepID=A0A1M5WAS9_9FIRM|nr:glycoside-pentoside-hexuronide (GPH):cation symporter [Sporobacter termitidis]SHH84605.1 glycoside/pentoside/hexuronide:cation symporter, GPH family [Sporobacter termitidis DSM 10068]